MSRIEKDSLGEVEVPESALYGPQTARAIHNFPISGLKFQRAFIKALGLIKGACAKANWDLKILNPDIAKAIIDASDSIAMGHYDSEFPVDIFQTGSGTSTNMNANEVIAHLAEKRSNVKINPNDHVNMCQSSNDVIPTAIHVSSSLEVQESLLKSLQHLTTTLQKRSKELDSIVKTGRTHLMDALPVTFGQELSGWMSQIQHGIQRIEATLPRLHALAIGGTAVGTGVNAHPEFANRVCVLLSEKTGIPFRSHPNYFEALSSQDTIVELSGQIRVVAVSLTKISNDIRLMNSGPLTGMAEITLPALQPGSSIMPGKVNPVIAEALCMVCAQIFGNDATIAFGGQAGNFQLNTMLPVIAYNILQSIELLSNVSRIFADDVIQGFMVNVEKVTEELEKNPILITALNPVIGYEKGASIAKRAYHERKKILDVAKEMTELSHVDLQKILNPKELTKGGLKDKK